MHGLLPCILGPVDAGPGHGHRSRKGPQATIRVPPPAITVTPFAGKPLAIVLSREVGESTRGEVIGCNEDGDCRARLDATPVPRVTGRPPASLRLPRETGPRRRGMKGVHQSWPSRPTRVHAGCGLVTATAVSRMQPCHPPFHQHVSDHPSGLADTSHPASVPRTGWYAADAICGYPPMVRVGRLVRATLI